MRYHKHEAKPVIVAARKLEADPKLQPKANWQTRYRGTNSAEYDIYRSCANDGNGNDITTGKPLKTYDEWISS